MMESQTAKVVGIGGLACSKGAVGMSNGRSARSRLSPAQTAVAQLLGPLDGARIPGGCEQCDAYQTVEPAGPGIWINTVHHDSWCPALVAYERESR